MSGGGRGRAGTARAAAALAALLTALATPAYAGAAGDARCRIAPGSVAPAPVERHRAVGCEARAGEERPRRTADVSAVLFTSQVWPGVTFAALLSADTVASPGDYALTVGQVRVTALPAAQRDRVSASVEVTNLSTCLLLLDVRLRDDGAYVGDGWLLRVRARRAGQPPRPLVVTIPEVPLVTPLGVRTAANAFSAELSGRFVECERRTRPRAG